MDPSQMLEGLVDPCCPACAALNSLVVRKVPLRTCWDITLPPQWSLTDFEGFRLHPVSVPFPECACRLCNAVVSLIPAFQLSGTRLTVDAVAMVTYLYESTPVTWRQLPVIMCDSLERIAHSTLYRAVHGLGRSLEIQKVLEHLMDTVPEHPIEPKSREPHTRAREREVRKVLAFLVFPVIQLEGFVVKVLRALQRCHQFLRRTGIKITRLYARQDE